MEIRKANIDDLCQIMSIYSSAREYMKESGNPTQWGNSYPPVEVIENDIHSGISYVICENGMPHGVFVFFTGDDPTYSRIEGDWLNDLPYGVIHRIGSDGTVKGIFSKISAFCKDKISNLRIDTHNNNLTMQHLLDKHGFKHCGTIYLANGQPRMAYHFTRTGV